MEEERSMTWWVVALPLVDGWNQVIFRITSNVSHSMILRILDILHSSGGELQWWQGYITP